MRLGRAFRSQEDPSARGRVVRDGRACVAWRVLPSGARLRGSGPSAPDPLDSLATTPGLPSTSPTGPTSFHLLRYPSFVDKNRRYVSLPTPRRRRVQKMRSCDLVFCGNAATLLISQLESDSHIGDFCPREGGLSRGGSVRVLEPYQKGETAPHQLSSCSFSPLLRPRPSARLFIYPSACSASSRFRLALSAQSSSPLLRTPSALAPSPRVLGSSQTPSGVWFLRFVPALALSPCPSPVSHSRNFGSPESAFFPAPSAPSSPFLGAALTYT